ncbi:MAG: hypothetical protein E7647_05590 [Ruminococcaceae bacterium]|nr:hypothetical protein [Oscillospiraceae bacterium]
MKKAIRMIGFLLSVLILVSALSACASKEEKGTDTQPPEEEVTTVPQNMVSEKVTISEETYITTPATENLSVADDGYSIFVNNVLFVYAVRNTPIGDVEALAKKYGAEITGACDLDIYQLSFNAAMSMDELSDLALEIEEEDIVELCDMDFLMSSGESYMPNDKWYDNDFEDDEDDGDKKKNQWAINAINAPKAWDYLDMMSKVNVAVVEGNIDENHQDLNLKKVIVPSLTAGLADAIASKKHGTHVAGIMAATADNGKGITGVCAIPDTEIYMCANSSYITVKNAVFGLSELIKKHDVKVINISQYSNSEAAIISAAHGNQKAKDAIKDQARRAVEPLKRLLNDGYEFVIVVAGGNQNNISCWKDSLDREGYGYTTSAGSWSKGKTEYKGAEAEYAYYLSAIEDEELKDRIIVVGAVKQDKNGSYKSCDFSNTGDRVDVMAPGEKIFSCFPKNKYGLIKGTSQAAPHVAGVAAMVFGCDPDLTGAEVKDIIVSTADYSTKFDKVDAGLLQAGRAVELALGTGEFSTENQYTGMWSYVDLSFGVLSEIMTDVGFFDTMDYADKWFATGYYEDRASVVLEFDGSEEGDPDAVPTTMTVSALEDRTVLITEDIELGMSYHDAEILENVFVLSQNDETVVLQQTLEEGYELVMIFEVDGLDATLTSVTVSSLDQ